MNLLMLYLYTTITKTYGLIQSVYRTIQIMDNGELWRTSAVWPSAVCRAKHIESPRAWLHRLIIKYADHTTVFSNLIWVCVWIPYNENQCLQTDKIHQLNLISSTNWNVLRIRGGGSWEVAIDKHAHIIHTKANDDGILTYFCFLSIYADIQLVNKTKCLDWPSNEADVEPRL